MDIEVRGDGLLTEKVVQELAAWYDDDGQDLETFEAHLMMLRAYPFLVSSAQRSRRATLSIERYSLLRLLYRAPQNRMLLSEISRALSVSPASISKLVKGLERLQLVQRLSYPDDRRRAWAQLTSAGAKVLEENLPRARQATKARWHGLTKQEKRVLVHLLSKLILSVESMNAGEQLRAIEAEAASASEDLLPN